MDIVLIDRYMLEVASERLSFARAFLTQADELQFEAQNIQNQAKSGAMTLRLSLNRAYYACHHALRALYLRFDRLDPYGHQAAIDHGFHSREVRNSRPPSLPPFPISPEP